MYILKVNIKSIKKPNNIKNFLHHFKKKNIKINIFQTKQKKKIFTLLKSPHVNKKSREHFIYEKYNRNIYLKSSNLFQLINILFIMKSQIFKGLLFKTKIIKL